MVQLPQPYLPDKRHRAPFPACPRQVKNPDKAYHHSRLTLAPSFRRRARQLPPSMIPWQGASRVTLSSSLIDQGTSRDDPKLPLADKLHLEETVSHQHLGNPHVTTTTRPGRLIRPDTSPPAPLDRNRSS
ncbi:hypothetical protein B296_00005466 [Ensete ventricosum]|uniref:Uncharacterized protein n=1 Tax=Ensete ventricosum TaxID=4639 RepID=A0A427AI82_ENSVE|nr:hypothetical protein B296_00005466 [Ensete ventricosum]